MWYAKVNANGNVNSVSFAVNGLKHAYTDVSKLHMN